MFSCLRHISFFKQLKNFASLKKQKLRIDDYTENSWALGLF